MEYVSIQIPAALYAKIYGLYQEESSTVILRSLNQLTNEEQEKTKVSETPKDGITDFSTETRHYHRKSMGHCKSYF